MSIMSAVRAFVARVSLPFIRRVACMGQRVATRLASAPRGHGGPARGGVRTPAAPAARHSGVWPAHSSTATARSGQAVPPRARPSPVEDPHGTVERPSASVYPVRDAYKLAPPALRYVGLSPPSLHALNTRSMRRIEARFASKVCLSAGDGIYAAHCNGPKCDRSEFVCGCPCLSCDLRRALYEQATIEIVGPRVALAHAPAHAASVHERIVERWHFLQLACEADGSPALHCDGPDCRESEERTLCECGCESCGRAVGLLVQAERDVVDEPEARS